MRQAVAQPLDQASHQANAERLRAALLSGLTDTLRQALRSALGTVICRPEGSDRNRYLHARFEGGDEILLDWLCYVGNDEQPGTAGKGGLDTLVAGAGFEPATFGL